MSAYRKAIVAAVSAFVVIVEPLGLNVDTETQQAIVALLTAVAVFAVGNE